MNAQHKSNLARTAIALLDSFHPLRMHSFCSDKLAKNYPKFIPLSFLGNCNTTTCFLGYAPIALPEIEIPDGYTWREYGNLIFDIDFFENPIWDFLFSHLWPNNKIQCAARALFILENNHLPDYNWQFSELYFPDDPKILKERLEKFC